MRAFILVLGLSALAATPALALTIQAGPQNPDVAQHLNGQPSPGGWGGGTANVSRYSGAPGVTVSGYDVAYRTYGSSFGSPRWTQNGDPLPSASAYPDQTYQQPWREMPTGRRESGNPLSLTLPRR